MSESEIGRDEFGAPGRPTDFDDGYDSDYTGDFIMRLQARCRSLEQRVQQLEQKVGK